MSWTTPITDRTEDDVTYALENQDSVSDLKGAWNISDANRVIDNSIYLRDLLNSYGYTVSFADQPHLTVSDFPYITSVIKLMKDNIQLLLDAFYTEGNPSLTYSQYANYNSANSMEINLDITNTLLENMIAELIYCGEPYSGDDIIL